jgi:hypothetical protein
VQAIKEWNMEILIVKNNENIIITKGNSIFKIPINGYENYSKEELLELYKLGRLGGDKIG